VIFFVNNTNKRKITTDDMGTNISKEMDIAKYSMLILKANPVKFSLLAWHMHNVLPISTECIVASVGSAL
jgi:hypothetical protein